MTKGHLPYLCKTNYRNCSHINEINEFEQLANHNANTHELALVCNFLIRNSS